MHAILPESRRRRVTGAAIFTGSYRITIIICTVSSAAKSDEIIIPKPITVRRNPVQGRFMIIIIVLFYFFSHDRSAVLVLVYI